MWIAGRINGRAALPAAAATVGCRCVSACCCARTCTATTAGATAATCGSRILLSFPSIDIITGSAVRYRFVVGPDVCELGGFPIHHLRGFHHAAMTCDRQPMAVHVHVDIVVCFLIKVAHPVHLDSAGSQLFS